MRLFLGDLKNEFTIQNLPSVNYHPAQLNNSKNRNEANLTGELTEAIFAVP
jgi:hypothetical protein